MIVRSTDPLRTARLLFRVLQQQKNVNVFSKLLLLLYYECISLTVFVLFYFGNFMLSEKIDLTVLQTFQLNVTYTSKPSVFCHTATVQFGREAYTGVGLTEEAARSMADFYAIQQTSYDFDEVPPGVAIGYQVIFPRSVYSTEQPSKLTYQQES